MKNDRLTMELIRQEPNESDVAFMKRVMLKLEEIQSKPETRMIMPLPTENAITGILTYHLTILSETPEATKERIEREERWGKDKDQ